MLFSNLKCSNLLDLCIEAWGGLGLLRGGVERHAIVMAFVQMQGKTFYPLVCAAPAPFLRGSELMLPVWLRCVVLAGSLSQAELLQDAAVPYGELLSIYKGLGEMK